MERGNGPALHHSRRKDLEEATGQKKKGEAQVGELKMKYQHKCSWENRRGHLREPD